MIKLSICIPTYNFGEFIGETLYSILSQVTSDVEVIVLDGGSADKTASVVKNIQEVYPSLIYFNQNFRGGIDRDIEKVVGLAQGDYCWLFSADDIMLPGSIVKVLEAISSGFDVYLCEHVLCDIEMNKISDYPIFNNIRYPRCFDFNNPVDKDEYFNSALNSEAFFSFMSSPIFNKKSWNSISIPESFYGTCWVVAGHLLSLVPLGIKVNCMGEVLLRKRCENDSFLDRGVVNRYRIAIEGFQYVANALFGRDSNEAFNVRRVLQNELPLRALLIAKIKTSESPDTEDIGLLRDLVKLHYSDNSFNNYVKRFVFDFSPVFAIRAMQLLKRQAIKLTRL